MFFYFIFFSSQRCSLFPEVGIHQNRLTAVARMVVPLEKKSRKEIRNFETDGLFEYLPPRNHHSFFDFKDSSSRIKRPEKFGAHLAEKIMLNLLC